MPPKKKPYKSTKRARVRRCTLCNRIGHNARTCTDGVEKITPILPSQKASKKHQKKKSAVRSVTVHVTKDTPMSPHVVSLKPAKKENPWESIQVYHSKTADTSSTISKVDLAHLVRKANTQGRQNEGSKKHAFDPQSEGLKVPKVDILKRIPFSESDPYMPGSITLLSQKTKHITHGTTFHIPRIPLHHRSITVVRQSHGTIIKYVSEKIQRSRVVVRTTRARIAGVFSLKKFIAVGVTVVVLMSIPYPAVGFYKKVQDDTARIITESTHAFLSLQSSTVAAFHHDLPQAQYDLSHALTSFTSAQTLIDKEYKALVYVLNTLPVVGTKIKSRQDLLEAGHALALGNAYVIKGIGDATDIEDATTLERMKIIQTHLRGALPHYDKALVLLDRVEQQSLPAEFQESFVEFRSLFHLLIQDMRSISDVVSGVELILGSEGFRRYLVVFQNHHELRPTGGFAGSYAIVDVQSGAIQDIVIPGNGSYDLRWDHTVHVKPPVPIQLINTRWEFQDANWFPDFRASAEKFAWFFEKSRHTTVDGVIAINASVLERILRVVGPVAVDSYDVLLDADNAIKELRYEIESYDYSDGKVAPKAILSVVFEHIFDMIENIEPEQLVLLITELADALNQREIQAYFTDERVHTLVKSFGWTGELLETSSQQDYLMVVNANLGGGKSDVDMVQRIQHQSIVESDGSIINTVIISREHKGTHEENSLFGHVNSSYLRIYVPEGSELLDAGGFVYPDESSFTVPPQWYGEDQDLLLYEQEQQVHQSTGTRIVNEFGKTSFGNWVITHPKSETHVYFTYRLPFRIFGDMQSNDIDASTNGYIGRMSSFASNRAGITSRYSAVVQKQSGMTSEYTHAVIYPDGWIPMWKSGDDVSLSFNGASVSTDLETDRIFGIIMKQDL